jgi:hypothetical protein
MGIEPFTGPVDSLSSGLVGIKNSGNLPATNVKWAIQIQLSTDRRWPTPRIYQELEGDNVLAPGAIMRQGSDPIVFAYGNFEEFRISYYIYVYGGSLTLTGSLPDDGQISAIDTTASTLTIRRQPWVAIVCRR